MGFFKTYFSVIFLVFAVLYGELHQRVFAERSAKFNNFSGYPTVLGERVHKACPNCRSFSNTPVCSPSNISLDQAPPELFPLENYGSQEDNMAVVASKRGLESANDRSSDIAEDYYCDPSSSNCPQEDTESTYSHPVVLAQRDINLPRDVTAITLNIVLDIEAMVEFHENDQDEEHSTLSLSLTSDKRNNHANCVPSLNYRMLSLGSEAEVLLFVGEQGASQFAHSMNNIPTVVAVGGFFIATTITLLCLGFMRNVKTVRHFPGGIKISHVLSSSGGQDNSAHADNTKYKEDPARADMIHGSESCNPELHKDPRYQASLSATGEQGRVASQTKHQSSQSRSPWSCEEGKREVESRPDASVELRRSVVEDPAHGETRPRPTQKSVVEHHVSWEEAPPTRHRLLRPRTELIELQMGKDRFHQNQQSTNNFPQDHQRQKTNSNMSSSPTYSYSSVCADATNCPDQSHYPEDVLSSTSSHSYGPIRKRLPLRALAFLLFGTFILVAVAVGVSKIRAKPTLHVVFPGKDIVRKVRMFSDFPDLTQLSKNHSSLSLVSRLQLLDTKRCRDELQECKISIVCDPTTRQGANCRCRTGYYFRDWQCHECSTRCPPGHYLLSSCAADSDAVCKACTQCGDTQYEAAPCSTDRDTICVDVSFPVGILPMKRSHLPDDGLRISVTHSPNVFLERLADMDFLETKMYVTNNQQGLFFVWPRASGLEIAVDVSDVYLIPEYRDVDAKDDSTLFNRLVEPTKRAKDYYRHVQGNFCRHPVPDYYSLQLIQENRSSLSKSFECNSNDPSRPACPPNLKEGDLFTQRFLDKPCPYYKFPGEKESADHLTDVDNSVVCKDETEMAKELFGIAWPESVRNYLFPNEGCVRQKRSCEKCVNSAPCPEIEIRNYTFSLEDNKCCGIPCYSKPVCKKAYVPKCEDAIVACAAGEVDTMSLFPQFPSMEREFSCHLQYSAPPQLYRLRYSIRVPSIDVNISEKHFSVSPTSPQDHQERLTRFDFIQAQHETRIPVKEEAILQGDHAELNLEGTTSKPYRLRWLKSPEELGEKTHYTTERSFMMSYIQFERPFLYSSSTWKRDGCYKNMSQIYPNQTIYGEKVIPVTARKTKLLSSPSDSDVKEFRYKMLHIDDSPFIKFFVDERESVLQYLQGSSVHGVLVPSSLYGQVTWHHASSTWQLLFAGRQLNCPTVVSLKIFTQMMTGCAGYFDILINCPEDFTVTFNLTTDVSDLPDVFVIQANDSKTSHNLVLSSLYSPLQVDELERRSSGELSRKLGEGVTHQKSHENQKRSKFIVRVWLPLLAVVITAIILLLMIYGCYSYINANIPRLDSKTAGGPAHSPGASTGLANANAASTNVNGGNGVEPPIVVVALNNQGEKTNHVTNTTTSIATAKDKSDASRGGNFKSDEKTGSSQSPKGIIIVFIILYVIYSLVFSFSVTFGTLYLTQSQVWSNVSNPENLAQELHIEVDRSLSEIRDFENRERERIFESFLERRRACVNHLEQENSRLLQDYDSTMRKQLHTIFVQNGTLHQFTAEIQRQNVSAYISQIKQFVQDCNKTVNSIVELFESNYHQFLKATVNNDWLEIPRQIFLLQMGDSKIFVDSLSTGRVKQLAAWLDIDKVGELLHVQDNVFGRLRSVHEPQVTSLDMTFPSAHPGTPPLPRFDSEYQTFSFVPLDPPDISSFSSSGLQIEKANISYLMESMPRVTSFSALGGHRSLIARHKRSAAKSASKKASGGNSGGNSARDGYDSFGLSGSLKANPDSSEFSDELFDTMHTAGSRSSFDKDTLSSKIATSLSLEASENEDFDYGYENLVSDIGSDSNSDYGSEESIDHVTNIDQSRGQKQPFRPYRHNSKENGYNIDVLSVQNLRRKTELVSVQTVPMHVQSNLITDDHSPAARYDTLAVSSSSGGQTKDSGNKGNHSRSERWLYGLIAMFLTLDVVLWAYRLSWLSRQLHAARHGYADRIPTDDACKQVIEIQTAYHLPAFDSSGAGGHDDSSSGYYVDGKDHSFYTSDLSGGVTGSAIREPSENMTFLQTLPRSRDDSILQKIWQQKMSKAEAEKLEKLERGYGVSKRGISRHWHAFCAGLQRLFLSQLIWQATVTFLAIILLCLLVHCASFWLTAEHFRVLVGAQSAVSDVQFQLHASDHHLRTLAHTLSQQLRRLQGLCDAEVDTLTSVFFDTVNMQTSMFSSLLQELCREAKGHNCESLSAHLSTGGRIVGCSFLPLQARTYHDLSLTQLESVLTRQVTPLLELSRRLLALSACIVASLLCARLVCQAAASTARHFLLLRGYLPRVRVYQAEETHNAGRSGVGASTLQRSQSWVDSCESGVYVCEADDGGLNNGGGAVAPAQAPPAVAQKEELVAVQPAR